MPLTFSSCFDLIRFEFRQYPAGRHAGALAVNARSMLFSLWLLISVTRTMMWSPTRDLLVRAAASRRASSFVRPGSFVFGSSRRRLMFTPAVSPTAKVAPTDATQANGLTPLERGVRRLLPKARAASRGQLADPPERMNCKPLSAALDAFIDHPASPTLSATLRAHRLEA